MKPKLFYNVRGTLFRTKRSEVNLVEVNEKFKDENPIVARGKAFNCFQNYIDVFLESKGKSYISHAETVKELQDFVNSYEKKFFKIGANKIEDLELDHDYDKGLYVYMVNENSKCFTSENGETLYEDFQLIHYIDNQFTDIDMHIFDALLVEFSTYEKYGYDYRDFRREYNVSRLREEPKMKSILETPIDFRTLFNG